MIPAGHSALLETWFRLYTRNYLRRSFHTVHLLGDPPQQTAESSPLLLCVSHSSWWDLLIGFYLGTEVFGGENYGVMDERQLRRYRFFSKLGVIGVDRASLSGAKEFLRYCRSLLAGSERALWLTPQGEMLSPYARPVHFQPGIGHLAEALGTFRLMTVALHYEFWNERQPEAFVSLSPVARFDTKAGGFDRKAFVHAQERQMEVRLDSLLALTRTRDASLFTPLLRGKSGISPTYDALRSLAARLRGERFSPEHSRLLTPQWRRRDHTSG